LTDDPLVFDVHPAFSPDGSRVAFVRGVEPDRSNALWVCSADGAGAQELVAPRSESERFFAPVWLSDTQVGYTCDPELGRRPDMEFWCVGIEGGEPRRLFRFRDLPTRGNGLVTSASPDGKELAVVAQDGLLWTRSDLYVTDTAGNILATVWLDDPDDRKDARALWSPTGHRIAWHHNFTRGAFAEDYYYGVGMARRQADGEWETNLQMQRDGFVTPLASSPTGDALLCARMNRDGNRATFFLMDGELNPQQDLFELKVHGWQPGQREFARLADWSLAGE
jgi:Tol biopolymer transport system component